MRYSSKPASITGGSLFSGVGGFERGMSDVDFLWANEIDPATCETYKLNHPDTRLLECSIESIIQLPKVDVITAGFPCQSFSIAGQQDGFENTRGTLFFELLRIIDMVKPPMLLLENVANIVSHDKGKTIAVIERSLRDLGYHIHTAILDTETHTNIPQHRKRWFLVGFLEDVDYVFPEPIPLERTLHDVVEDNPDKSYYLTKGVFYERVLKFADDPKGVYIRIRKGVRKKANYSSFTLTKHMGTGGNNVPVFFQNGKLRKLTPLDCFTLQGYPDIQLPKLPKLELYKQAGNSVTATLVNRIWEKMKHAYTSTTKSN